jgi:hypothetical protein
MQRLEYLQQVFLAKEKHSEYGGTWAYVWIRVMGHLNQCI